MVAYGMTRRLSWSAECRRRVCREQRTMPCVQVPIAIELPSCCAHAVFGHYRAAGRLALAIHLKQGKA